MLNWSQFIESPGGGSAAPTPANDNPWSKFIEGQPDPNAEAEKEIADRESVLADPLPEETKAAIRQRHLKPPTPVPAPSPEIPAPPPTAGDVAKGYLSAIPSVLTHAATATGRGLVGLGQAAYLLPSGRPEDQIGAKPGDVSALGEINAAAKEANARADTSTAAAPGATTVAGFAGNMVPWFINPALGAGSMAGESYLDQIEHHPDSPGKARVAGAIMGLAGFAMGGAGKIGGAALAPLERGLSKLAMPTIGKVASVAGEGYSMGVPLAMGSSVSESLWDTDAGQRALEEGLTSPTMALVVLFHRAGSGALRAAITKTMGALDERAMAKIIDEVHAKDAELSHRAALERLDPTQVANAKLDAQQRTPGDQMDAARRLREGREAAQAKQDTAGAEQADAKAEIAARFKAARDEAKAKRETDEAKDAAWREAFKQAMRVGQTGVEEPKIPNPYERAPKSPSATAEPTSSPDATGHITDGVINPSSSLTGSNGDYSLTLESHSGENQHSVAIVRSNGSMAEARAISKAWMDQDRESLDILLDGKSVERSDPIGISWDRNAVDRNEIARASGFTPDQANDAAGRPWREIETNPEAAARLRKAMADSKPAKSPPGQSPEDPNAAPQPPVGAEIPPEGVTGGPPAAPGPETASVPPVGAPSVPPEPSLPARMRMANGVVVDVPTALRYEGPSGNAYLTRIGADVGEFRDWVQAVKQAQENDRVQAAGNQEPIPQVPPQEGQGAGGDGQPSSPAGSEAGDQRQGGGGVPVPSLRPIVQTQPDPVMAGHPQAGVFQRLNEEKGINTTVTPQQHKDGLAWKGVMPTFQGGKQKMAEPTLAAVDHTFGGDADRVTEIHDLFGGGGGWGAFLGLSRFRNLKRLVVSESDPVRLSRIRFFHERGDQFAQIGESSGAFDIVRKEWENLQRPGQSVAPSSAGGVSGRVSKYLDRPDLSPDAKAILSAFVDYGDASFGGKGIHRLIATASDHALSAKKGADALRQRGVRIEYKNADSFSEPVPAGPHVLAVADPPYYGTIGYNGRKVGADTYAKTGALMERLKSQGNSVIYTDEAWWAKRNKAGVYDTPVDWQQGVGILDRTQRTMDHFAVVGNIAGRNETLGVNNGFRSRQPDSPIQDVADRGVPAQRPVAGGGRQDYPAGRPDHGVEATGRMAAGSAGTGGPVAAPGRTTGPAGPGQPAVAGRPAAVAQSDRVVPVHNIADFERGMRQVYHLTPDQATAVTAVVRARADALGQDRDAFAAKVYAAIRRGKGSRGALYQTGPGGEGSTYRTKSAEIIGSDPKLPNKADGDAYLAYLKNKGVNEREMFWLGLDKLKGKKGVTKEMLKALANEPDLNLGEEVNSDSQPPGNVEDLPGALRAWNRRQPKFQRYTLPGGENYRELLLKMDIGTTNAPEHGYRSSHWDTPNVLLHARFNERTDAAGNKVLHIEEIQSDLHQAGRERGYTGDPIDAKGWTAKLVDERPDLYAVYDSAGDHARNVRASSPEQAISMLAEARENRVPAAPFAKTWEEVGFRRMIRQAAEQGITRVTWTTGEQQIDRYPGLETKVGAIAYNGSDFKAFDHDGNEVITRTGVSPDEIPALIGKEPAQRLFEKPGNNGLRTLSGLELKIGGEGMSAAYDHRMVSIAKNIGKKFGVEPGMVGLPGVGREEAISAALEEIAKDGIPDQYQVAVALNSVGHRQRGGNWETALKSYISEHGHSEALDSVLGDQRLIDATKQRDGVQVHYLDITPEMAKDAMGGVRLLFQGDRLGYTRGGVKKGAISFLEDGRAVLHALGATDVSTAIHEIGHSFRRTLNERDSNIAAIWSGCVRDAKGAWIWTRAAEEKFARAFERWVREGNAPVKPLEGVFQKLKSWLSSIYQQIKGTPIDVNLTPNMRDLFRRMLTPKDGTPTAEGRISQAHDVPLGGSVSEGTPPTTYLDPGMPRTLTMDDGKVADVAKYTRLHEEAEKPAMDAQGKSYAKAHVEDANPAENAALRADGIDPAEYNRKLKPFLDAIEAKAKAKVAAGEPQNLPPDQHPKHVDEQERTGLAQGQDMPLGVENRRPDLAIPGEDPASRRAYVRDRNQMPEANATEARPQEPLRDQARVDVKSDPDSVFKGLQGAFKNGTFNDRQVAEVHALLEHFHKTGDKDSFRNLSFMYHVSGTEGARALAMRADQMMSPEGRLAEARTLAAMPRAARSAKKEALRRKAAALTKQMQLLYQTEPDTARKLANRVKKINAAIARIEAKNAFIYEADKKYLKREGFDLDAPSPEWAKDPRNYAQFLSAMEGMEAGVPGVSREIYLGLLHASGLVAGKKIIADGLGIPIYGVKLHLAALYRGKAGRGELSLAWQALLPSLHRAAANAFWGPPGHPSTIRSNRLPSELIGEEEYHQTSTLKRLWYPAGWVSQHATAFTTVRAIDSFTRSFIANIEVHAQAHRSAVDATGKRLEGEAYINHLAHEIGNTDSASWDKARAEAMRRTFMEPPPEIIRKIHRMKYQKANTALGKAAKLWANIAMPFTTIPTNIPKQGLLDWTPGASDLITIARNLRPWTEKGERWKGDGADAAAQATMRWVAFAVIGVAASSGGMITGGDDKLNPYSLNMFGHHFSYHHLGPFARVIGAAADWFGPGHPKNESKSDKAARILKGQWDMLKTAPCLSAAEDLLHAAERRDGLVRYSANLASGPLAFLHGGSIGRQIMTAQHDEIRAAQYDKRAAWYAKFYGYLHDRLNGNTGKPVMYKGKQLRKESFDSGVGTFLWRVFSPLTLGTETVKPGER